MKRLALVALLPMLLGVVFMQKTAAPPSGPVQTLFDDFSTDTNGWQHRNTITDCAYEASDGGVMDPVPGNGFGACHYEGESVHGTHPSDRDSWCALEYSSFDDPDHDGCGLRALSTTPGTTDYNYVMQCDSNSLEIRNCHTDAFCSNLIDYGGGTCSEAPGAQNALMVAGEGINTELCVWNWAPADPEPSDWSDPTTWGDADGCIGDGAGFTPTLLAAYADCGGNTDCREWLDTPDNLRGYPAAGQTQTIFYNGSSVSTGSFRWFRAGDLNL